jgi:hypothetical protein
MHAIYAFGLLILIAYLGSRLIRKGGRSFSPFTFIFQSGLIYIALGLYLGRHGSNVLSPEILQSFRPLIALGLGWVGFVFGFQLEYRYLKRFPRRYTWLSLFLFFCVSLLAAVPLIWILERWFEDPRFYLHGVAVALGLLAAIHSPTLLNLVAPLVTKRGHYQYLARFLVSVGGFWALAGMMVLTSFWHLPFFEQGNVLMGLLLVAVSSLVPVLLGYLFHRLTASRVTEQDLLVYLLGMVFFVSGAAFYFNLIPVYVCMVLGIVYSNLTRRHERIYPILLASEKPLYIVLLILVGAIWEIDLDLRIAALVLLVLVIRTAGHMLSTPLLGRLLNFPFRLPLTFGLSLMSAGGLGIAFAVSIYIAYPMDLTNVFLSVALIVIIVGEILSPLAIKASLYRLGSEE